MMDCRAVRDALLEADLAELRGERESDLSRHLAGCADCRAAATRILQAEGALLHALQAPEARRPIESVVAAARAEAARRAMRRRAWRRWVPLAAAAGLGALVWINRRDPPRLPPPPRDSGPTATVTVEAPPGRNVAVLKTGNPDIVVIWFF